MTHDTQLCKRHDSYIRDMTHIERDMTHIQRDMTHDTQLHLYKMLTWEAH